MTATAATHVRQTVSIPSSGRGPGDLVSGDVLGRLAGIHISKKDRRLIYLALSLCVLGVGFVLWNGDQAARRDIAVQLVWVGFALIFVFVAGAAANRKIVADAVKPREPESAE